MTNKQERIIEALRLSRIKSPSNDVVAAARNFLQVAQQDVDTATEALERKGTQLGLSPVQTQQMAAHLAPSFFGS